MANTYTLINSTSLSSTAASVTFSAIPATFDDLLLSISSRTSSSGAAGGIGLEFNSNSSNYSRTRLNGDGSTVISNSSSGSIWIGISQGSVASGAASNTFSNLEIYIPSYRVSQNKPLSSFGATEDNATLAYLNAIAGLWGNTSAITSLRIVEDSGGNFVSGSTFWLYGIKNS